MPPRTSDQSRFVRDEQARCTACDWYDNDQYAETPLHVRATTRGAPRRLRARGGRALAALSEAGARARARAERARRGAAPLARARGAGGRRAAARRRRRARPRGVAAARARRRLRDLALDDRACLAEALGTPSRPRRTLRSAPLPSRSTTCAARRRCARTSTRTQGCRGACSTPAPSHPPTLRRATPSPRRCAAPSAVRARLRPLPRRRRAHPRGRRLLLPHAPRPRDAAVAAAAVHAAHAAGLATAAGVGVSGRARHAQRSTSESTVRRSKTSATMRWRVQS